jgi:hypothetical protein
MTEANEPSSIRISDINGGTSDNGLARSCIVKNRNGTVSISRVVTVIDSELFNAIAEQMWAGPSVRVNGKNIPVKRTSYQRLKMLSFDMNGRQYQAIEQNAEKPSRWGQLAREGHRVVQFRDVKTGRYVAVSVDGEVKEYTR